MGVGRPHHYPGAVGGAVHAALHAHGAGRDWRRGRAAGGLLLLLLLQGVITAAPQTAPAAAAAAARLGVLVVAAAPAAVVVVVVLVLSVLVVDDLRARPAWWSVGAGAKIGPRGQTAACSRQGSKTDPTRTDSRRVVCSDSPRNDYC